LIPAAQILQLRAAAQILQLRAAAHLSPLLLLFRSSLPFSSLSPNSVDGMEKELGAPFLPDEAGDVVDDHNALLSFLIWWS
jgi:hypothetical protein